MDDLIDDFWNENTYPLTFSRHRHGIFEWVTSSEWPRDASMFLSVSIELAEDMGWRRGKDLPFGQYRLRIAHWNPMRGILYCYRDSGPVEELIRKVLYRIDNLVRSGLRNFIPELKYQYRKRRGY